jgi:deoxyribodipyrimidine photo-lyase
VAGRGGHRLRRRTPRRAVPAQVVWLKRDLRLSDHAPLAEAARRGPIVLLYAFQPRVYQAPDFARQHFEFIRESLASLDRALAPRGTRVVVEHGEITAILERIDAAVGVEALWSHEETGNAVTYAIDREARAWCARRGIAWHERAQNGVVRRLVDRDGWSRRWEARMASPIVSAPEHIDFAPYAPACPVAIEEIAARVPGADKAMRQRGGRAPALAALESFLAERGQHYRSGMSSPLSAETQCSRVSPYLAWGTLSLREVVHATRARIAALRALPAGERPPRFLASLASFQGRLHWHCHFMQKLESEPEIEFRNLNRLYDGLREHAFDAARFEAWRSGETGFPLVDACMAMLRETGWINFRMRAMLMSFASYHLWLHWRETGLHLAREFLDYEPGIHWSQTQMQSGVTGINTLRIYNPVKQALDQDPGGEFVRRWLPALARVPDEHIHRPWLMPGTLQRSVGCVIGRDYPAPIVDHEAAAREARERIAGVRRQPAHRDAARDVLAQHGSRKRAPRPRVRRRAQANLEFDS